MPSSPTKAELQAELDARARTIHARTDALQREADPAAPPPPAHGGADDEHGDAPAKTALLAAAGGLVAGVAIRRLAGGRGDAHEPEPARTRILTDTYLDRLAREVEARIGGGDSLADALGGVLGRRAPLRLEAPRSGGSALVRVLALGLVAASAAGLNLACRAYYGRSLVELVRARLGGDDDEPAYPPVHGTAGAEMPRPS